MELQTLTITAPLLLTMLYNRGLFWPANSFHFMLVLSCTFFVLATCGPCSIDGMKKSAEYDACRSYGGYQGAGLHDVIVGDTNMGYVIRTSVTHLNIENICTSSNSFCFPSTLPGLFSEDHKPRENSLEVSRIQSDDSLPVGSTETRKIASNKTWSSDYGTFGLLNGKTVSCSLNFKERIHELSSIQTDCGDQSDFSSCRGTSLNQHSTNGRLNMKSEMSKPGSFDTSSSPNVEISPPVLDWGHKNLFFPSVAFLTVANSCNDSILHVYEPFSTNAQFYPCNFSEILLEPREVASICFVFLPRWLGLSESQLILQTSSGGFLVSAKGFGIESPYKIQPLMDLDVPSSGRLSKNLSLFNPFDETLQVKEVTAWVSVSLGNTTYQTEANCGVGHFLNSDETNLLSVKDWLVVDSGQVGSLLMAMRPHTNWGIGSRSSESIVEIDFSLGLEGKILGAFCLQLIRSSQNISDTVIVPLEVDLDRRAAYGDLSGPVLVSLQSLVAQDTGGTVVSISLRNRASYMLNLVSISEVADTKLFQIKYMEGLLLFPGTVTEVAVISCTQLPVELHNSFPEVSNMNRNCKLFLLINDSSSPQIEIPCQDIIRVCSRHQKDSTIGYEYKAGSVKSGNARAGSLGDVVKLPSEIEALETAEADELVLTNWKSQGLTIGMSVLDDHEVLFPMVQVGNHHSKWITVKNPSHHPVVMQLILNSGEIIDGCRGTDGLIQPPSSGSLEFTRPTRYGFSIAESAVTEAFVHPHSSASFGPILFTPSDRCAWRSSALIRNNLSGVEWVPLRGCGGLLSLVLLEGSEPIESVEFSLDLPVTHNVTPDMLFQVEDTRYACSQPLSKELYVKNTGDLPLEVRSIRISGTECGLDGFRVHTCRGFLLEPGESTTLLISYQTDFSAAMVHRDLELALATGIFVIPIKANLPVIMLNVCKKSVFWRLRKFSIAIIFAACVITLVFYFLYPQVMATGSPDCIYTDEKHSINTTRSAGKSSHVHCYQRNGKSSVPSETDCLLSSVGKGKTSKQASVDGYCESKKESQEQNVNAQPAEKTLENHTHANGFSDTLGKRGLLSLPPKPVAEDSDTVEASQTDNLTVRTGKEKARRRRKKKGACTGVTGLLEVSSSQSGNSTPSSPLSPITPLTSTRTGVASPDFDQSTESRNPVTHIADQHCQKVQVPEPMSQAKKLKPQLSPVKSFEPPLSQAKVLEPQLSQPKVLEPHLSQAEVLDPHLPGRYCNNNWYISTPAQSRVASKPVLLPSASFPCAGKAVRSAVCSTSPLTSTSTVASHARAPGSKIYDQKTVKGEPAGLRDEYTYDIWGDHFSGLGLMGSSKDATAVNSSAMVSHSDSFFVSGPQDLRTDSQSRSVSCSNDEG